jgi:hypothetical protein
VHGMVRTRRRRGCRRLVDAQPRRSLLGDAGSGLLLAAGGVAADRMARHHLAALAEVRPVIGSPVIDVVVPARNEASCIATCVAALRAQGDDVTVTVVDDASDDGTGDRAAQAGARVLRLEGPPPGWLGKPGACDAGAAAGWAPWLAFVDADVTLAPGALAALVMHAEEEGFAAISPLLRQRCTGLSDSLLVPFAFWQYAVGLPGAAQRGRHAILNGQCLVVSRRAYTECGGHAHVAVRGSVVDDSALARLLVGGGARIALVRGDDLGEVSMYSGYAELRAGFGKNVAQFLSADPGRGAVVAAAGMVLAAWLPLALRAVRRPSPGRVLGAAAAWLAPYAALRPHYRSAALSGVYAAAHPVAAALMQGIAVESLARSAVDRPLRWKGRRAGVL